MSRSRMAVLAAVVVVFVVGGGILIYANRSHGGVNRTIDVTVTGAKSMKPSQLTVNQNDTVTINITSDTDGEVHLHGYDIPFDCMAGQVVLAHLQGREHGQLRHRVGVDERLHLAHLVVT